MNTSTSHNKTVTLLFNPFFYIAGVQALALGLIAIALTAVIGYFAHAHFDGVLDTRLGTVAPLWLFFAEGLIDWLSLSIVLWAAGKTISRTRFRAVDVFGTQALARWPMIFIALLTLPAAFHNFSNELLADIQSGTPHIDMTKAALVLLFVFAMLPFLAWTLRLMYKGFSIACNVSGGKAIGTFIVGLLIAEIISKLFIAPVAAHALAQQPSKTATPISAAAAKELEQRGSQFVQLLQDGKFQEAVAQFSPEMKQAMTEQKLRGAWTSLTNNVGPFQKQLGANVSERDGFHLVLVTCQFERQAQGIRVVYDSDQRVSGLWYVEPDSSVVPK
jgi:hypothetical protein